MVRLLASYFTTQNRDLSTVRVLDWGTGKGHISYLLKQAGFDVVSCDIAENEHDSTFGQDTPIVEECGIEVIPLTHPWRLPFATGGFDLVVSFGVLEHVQDDQASLGEIRRIMRDGGIFFFSFLPYWLSWSQKVAHWRGNWYHDRLYARKEIMEKGRVAGFHGGLVWHGQLFPKNSIPHNNLMERVDRWATWFTPFKYLATNLEGFLFAE